MPRIIRTGSWPGLVRRYGKTADAATHGLPAMKSGFPVVSAVREANHGCKPRVFIGKVQM
jgi:hypothetical protein